METLSSNNGIRLSDLVKNLATNLSSILPLRKQQEIPEEIISEILSRLPVKTLLRFRSPFKLTIIEIMIFSLSSLSWRKIDVDLPVDIVGDWKHGVCVNSVMHFILPNNAFDLITEKFTIISIPVDAIGDATYRINYYKGLNTRVSNQPFLMKINGFLGLMCHNHVMEFGEMDTKRL
ncbi:hypothetical protein L1987_42663 [Smallanthus sonchifolius]|uniref:Uncharacterized protein n=1 Tax=Smallanthus sonchifolius TaxID=185202 RepID=A0ACB9GJ06_9ASTR|nr:hypothetical protein L1987_42663 [Smallanthus sonchifolius]